MTVSEIRELQTRLVRIEERLELQNQLLIELKAGHKEINQQMDEHQLKDAQNIFRLIVSIVSSALVIGLTVLINSI